MEPELERTQTAATGRVPITPIGKRYVVWESDPSLVIPPPAVSLWAELLHLITPLGFIFAIRPEFVDVAFAQMFDADVSIPALADANQFVKLGVKRRGVPVLGVLNQEDHEECDDGRAGIDDQLPGI